MGRRRGQRREGRREGEGEEGRRERDGGRDEEEGSVLLAFFCPVFLPFLRIRF